MQHDDGMSSERGGGDKQEHGEPVALDQQRQQGKDCPEYADMGLQAFEECEDPLIRHIARRDYGQGERGKHT
jgi:hypothetical protein